MNQVDNRITHYERQFNALSCRTTYVAVYSDGTAKTVHPTEAHYAQQRGYLVTDVILVPEGTEVRLFRQADLNHEKDRGV